MVNSSANNDNITVPYQYANLQLWKNTAVAKLTSSSAARRPRAPTSGR